MRASGTQRGRGGSGFTLVELMVVIIIIGIVSAVMLSEMRGTFEDTLLRGVARKVIDACDLASNRAIATHQTHLLKIDSKGGRFAVAPRGATSSEETGVDLIGAAGELDTRITLLVKEPESGELEEELPPSEERERRASADVITFYADGTCDAREFLLKDRERVEMTLRLNPITSRVRILEMATK